MKVVVTGATGHMGAYLCERLARSGATVVAASRAGLLPRIAFEPASRSPNVCPLALDLASETAVSTLAAELGPDVALVHLAAWHPPATASSTPADRGQLLEINVMGTLRLLDAARQAGASKIVYASTFEVYGIPPLGVPVTEDSPTRPFSDYGASKLSGEDHLFAFADEQPGVPVFALRMPAIYGPGEHVSRALPNFLRSVARGERPRVYGDGLDRRDQLHAADAALGVECSLGSTLSGVYNLADGEPHTILDLARTALEISGLGGEPELLPAQKQRFDFHMDTGKIQRELGFRPSYRLADGMAEQLRWLRAQA
ncbi:MAG TPA: NAD(P)-dependent oxidoreductase [Polyangiaceae bacterium]|nr:NAD(P)-dependent oxidoreductase [Polyangiaceae bacterium]